ncbi:GNAT family N-acetyltransferase [Kribbella kalugense]|uniref:Putative GNAT superfamily acetyltransferase n=1 Tax=Kribbella kalugense TaxID=2512221 RepID=A0A4R7ZA13_9ACTN|nr:GNAT family N-acetyltransferase [Kribbella kalugense]TDW14259.1 putative GNAT superfamily acetyltransferase [Kribbella kalugense]
MTIDLGLSIAVATEAGLAAATAARVQVRELRELAELDAVYRLYDSIWRPDPKNPPVTTELLRALTKAGNYVGGAYDGDELIGACVGFFSAPAEVAMHSHVAGVSGLARGRNVGFALKLHQRAWALRRGVSTIAWTFDPLIRRNAYFNVAKLAAQPAEYLTNFYGDMRDGINSGDDTDRLLVRWELDSPAVAAAAARRSLTTDVKQMPGATVALACGEDGRPQDGSKGSGGPVLVGVPPDVEGLRRTDPGAAKAWRTALREVLGGLLADGAVVTGFDRSGWYVLEKGQAG